MEGEMQEGGKGTEKLEELIFEKIGENIKMWDSLWHRENGIANNEGPKWNES